MADSPFKKKGAAKVKEAPVAVGDSIENAIQAAAQLHAAVGSGAIDTVRAAVDAWIAGDSERAKAVTLEYYAKCDGRGVPRR